jgi:hypothetical protein
MRVAPVPNQDLKSQPMEAARALALMHWLGLRKPAHLAQEKFF